MITTWGGDIDCRGKGVSSGVKYRMGVMDECAGQEEQNTKNAIQVTED